MHVCGILIIKRSWKGRRSEDPLVGRFQLRELRRDQITHRRHRPVRVPRPVICLSDEAPDSLTVADVFDAMRVSLRPDVSSFRALVNEMGNLWRDWAAGETNFVLVSSLSPGDQDGSFPRP